MQATLKSVVESALAAEPPEPRDAAVAALAITYASEIDSGEADLGKLGPALLGALEALHLSPRARAAAQKGLKNGQSAGPRQLDQLRDRRARKHAAAAGDPAHEGPDARHVVRV